LALQPEAERVLPEEELARAVGQRVEAGGQAVVVDRVRAVEADVGADGGVPPVPLPVVERPPGGPAVVRLPGQVGALEEQVGRAGGWSGSRTPRSPGGACRARRAPPPRRAGSGRAASRSCPPARSRGGSGRSRAPPVERRRGPARAGPARRRAGRAAVDAARSW